MKSKPSDKMVETSCKENAYLQSTKMTRRWDVLQTE